MTLSLLIAYVISVSMVLLSPVANLSSVSGNPTRYPLLATLGRCTGSGMLLLCTCIFMYLVFWLSQDCYALLGLLGSLYIFCRGLFTIAAALLPQPNHQPTQLAEGSHHAFTSGLAATLRNHYCILFFIAFLPMFSLHGSHFVHSLIQLALLWLVLEVVAGVLWHCHAQRMVLKRHQAVLILATGTLLIGLALNGFTHYLSFMLTP